MAQPKSVTVDFHEAFLAANMPSSDLFGPAIIMKKLFNCLQASYTFEASNAAEALRKVEALASEHGQSCAAFVRMTDRTARKFPGFDKTLKSLYYNLTPEPVES